MLEPFAAMTTGFRFDPYLLDPENRKLTRDGVPVELNARYFDALTLLVREQGKLVSKDRFMAEVWRGVPVTDEALTQCVRTLRRSLADNAARPRFIETVPKHGYRFIAPVQAAAEERPTSANVLPERSNTSGTSPVRHLLLLGAAGTVGAGLAGIMGGLAYGFTAAAQRAEPAMGSASVLLVLLVLTAALALIGGAGVSFGIAAAGLRTGRSWLPSVAGGALGGLVVGAVVKLLGLDALDLLFGRSLGDMTGAAEGALLGGAVGLGAWVAGRSSRRRSVRRAAVAGALTGGAAGILIPLLGGRLMGGSLELLARTFPDSRLSLGAIGGLFGESGLGPISQTVTGSLEGALFGGCIVGGMTLARRKLKG